MKIKYTKLFLEEIIKKSKSRKELLFNLGIKKENSQTHLIKKIKEYNIDISHFNKTKREYKKRDIKEYFIINSNISRGVIRDRIKKDNLIPYICECCGQDENWQGKIMPLILDHKNGINNDNRLENLRFLCSNCDSIQDTYKNKNKKISKELKDQRERNKKELNLIKKSLLLEQKINFWKEKILKSNIDFSKKTWGVEISRIMKKSPQYCLKFVKENNLNK